MWDSANLVERRTGALKYIGSFYLKKKTYIRSSHKNGFWIIIGCFYVVALFATSWNDEYPSLITSWNDEYIQSFFPTGNSTIWHNRQSSKAQGTPITLSCPPTTTHPACSRPIITVPSQTQISSHIEKKQNSVQVKTPSCPEHFRYIHEDLKPWRATGITKEMVESTRKHANVNFRLAIIGGRVYLEQYSKSFEPRDEFTIWGILQLVKRYPGRVPDLEMMFNCDDPPALKADDFRSLPAPPLFRYCKDANTLDIVFPDWSFWGWPEVNIKPWEQLLEEILNENKRLKWKDREPYAHWRGNPSVAWTRGDLLRCNVSNEKDWNARVFNQDWNAEFASGLPNSNLATQCKYRYKIYIEGRAWSVSEKYILACDSPMLLVTTPYIDFFTRGLFPGRHYWPIRPDQKCESIKYAVDWGNKHQKEAQKIGKLGSLFTQEELSMENVYEYMLHLLTEYAKLLRYKPTIPEKATEICMESMACTEVGLTKQYFLDSMVKSTYDFEPCFLPPPFTTEEINTINQSKDDYLRLIAKEEVLNH